MLVGNKIDLAEKRVVSQEEGEQKAKELDIMQIEASAKSGMNIKALFKRLAQSLAGADGANTSNQNRNEFQLGQQTTQETKKSGCCK